MMKHRKPKSALARLVETGVKYEDAVRLHSLMQKNIDEERNVQAGKVYDLAQSFRAQVAEVDPHFDELYIENRDLKNLLEELRSEVLALGAPLGDRKDEMEDILKRIDDRLPAEEDNDDNPEAASNAQGQEKPDVQASMDL